MKKATRSILCLALILILVCTLAIASYASENEYEVSAVGADVWCNEVKFHTLVGGDGSFAIAKMVEVQSGENRFSGTVTLNYTYCPDNQLRPSAYITGSASRNFTSTSGARYIDYFANYDYIMIDATGYTVVTQTVNGTRYTTEAAPVSIYIN